MGHGSIGLLQARFFGGEARICIQLKLIIILCGHRLRKELKDDQPFTVLKNELHMDFFKAIKGSEFSYRYYFHVNGRIGIVQKIDFEIRPDLGYTTPKTSKKVVLYSCLLYTSDAADE